MRESGGVRDLRRHDRRDGTRRARSLNTQMEVIFSSCIAVCISLDIVQKKSKIIHIFSRTFHCFTVFLRHRVIAERAPEQDTFVGFNT